MIFFHTCNKIVCTRLLQEVGIIRTNLLSQTAEQVCFVA